MQSVDAFRFRSPIEMLATSHALDDSESGLCEEEAACLRGGSFGFRTFGHDAASLIRAVGAAGNAPTRP